MKSNEENSLTVGGLDWITILVYTVLVLMGWVNIYAAVYDEAHSSIFDISQRYGMQLIWIGVSAFIAISILLIDDKYYHILAYPLYWFSILVLIGVLLFGKEVNGAKSWLFGIQPSEFVKFTTALALARYMSSYSFDIRNLKHLLHVAILLGLPVLIVMLQNDTGSALVFGSFLFMLYREGFNGWVYIALIMIISLFIFSFLLEPTALLIVLILVCVVGEGMTNGNWRSKAIYLAGLAKSVTVAVRSYLKADPIACDKLRSFENVTVLEGWNASEFCGDGRLRSVRLKNQTTGEEKEVECVQAFEYIGQIPATDCFRGLGVLNAAGYVEADEQMRTKVPGIYAAGECIVKNLRQVITACADGAIAAQEAAHYVQNLAG